MWNKQNGICPICARTLDAVQVHVDHDHACCAGQFSCGRCVRGLLCRSCNVGLGHFADPEMLLRAFTYLGLERPAPEQHQLTLFGD